MSTLKVDTYLTRGGASEIAIDKLKGASSAASMTVVGEGGTTTTNLQQGLAKAWVQFDGTASGAAARDSFNVSGMTDNGTGDHTVTFNNDMAGASNYSASGNGGQFSGASANDVYCFHKSIAAGSIVVQVIRSQGSLTDQTFINCIIHGDLA